MFSPFSRIRFYSSPFDHEGCPISPNLLLISFWQSSQAHRPADPYLFFFFFYHPQTDVVFLGPRDLKQIYAPTYSLSFFPSTFNHVRGRPMAPPPTPASNTPPPTFPAFPSHGGRPLGAFFLPVPPFHHRARGVWSAGPWGAPRMLGVTPFSGYPFPSQSFFLRVAAPCTSRLSVRRRIFQAWFF